MFIRTDISRIDVIIDNLYDNCRAVSGLCDEAYETVYRLRMMDGMHDISRQLDREIAEIEYIMEIMRRLYEVFQLSADRYVGCEEQTLQYMEETQSVKEHQIPVSNRIPEWIFNLLN